MHLSAMAAITDDWITNYGDELAAFAEKSGRLDKAQRIRSRWAHFAEAARPVLFEFWSIGFEIGYFEDLVANEFYRSHANFRKYAHLLLRALEPGEDVDVRRSAAWTLFHLARSTDRSLLLAELVRIYELDDDDDRPGFSPKYEYAQSIKKLATRGDFEMLESLIGKPEPSSGDVFLIQAMGKVSDPRAFDFCRDLLSDLSKIDSPDKVTIWKIDAAIYALGAMHDERAIPLIKPFREYSDPDVRDQARKAVKKIERAVLRAAERTRTAAVEDPDSNVVGFPDRQL